ncbi:hypothetical protein [Deinococcus kurensis]|uniref:hypothetical protein n=1 Tax=Deinococcus kurensis TaxID=2662757 RepID=UPI0012D3623A|nr:hypothetical protein [Deinococcus kurensis]
MLTVFDLTRDCDPRDVQDAVQALQGAANAQFVTITYITPSPDWTVRVQYEDGQSRAYAHPVMEMALHAAFKDLLPTRADLYPPDMDLPPPPPPPMDWDDEENTAGGDSVHVQKVRVLT